MDSTGLLIGMDCPDALILLETAAGMAAEPYGIRTRLGWSLSGPISDGEGAQHSSHFILNHGASPIQAMDKPTYEQRLEEQLACF